MNLLRYEYSTILMGAIVFLHATTQPVLLAQDETLSAASTPYEIQRGLAFAEKLRTAQSQNSAVKQPPHPTSATSAPPAFTQRIELIQGETKQTLDIVKKLELEIQSLQVSIAALEELTRLKADFVKDEPMVRHYLSALFKHGYSQPDKGFKHKRTDTLGPVSLEALRKFGALEPTERGMLMLGHAGADASNDRGRDAFPLNMGGSLEQHEFEFLLPARKFLIKYQKLLVHNGLLAP